MRETVRSLRAYFVIVGLITGGRAIASLLTGPSGVGAWIEIVPIALAAAHVYVGVRLEHLLTASPGQVNAVVIAGGILAAIALTISVIGMWLSAMFWSGVQLLIAWYLFVNVKRLSREALQTPSSVAAEA